MAGLLSTALLRPSTRVLVLGWRHAVGRQSACLSSLASGGADDVAAAAPSGVADPLSLAEFEIPDNLVAQELADPPDSARLMVVRRDTGAIEHNWHVSDLPKLLDGSFTAVVNNSMVENCKVSLSVPAARDTAAKATTEGGGDDPDISTATTTDVFILREERGALAQSWAALLRVARDDMGDDIDVVVDDADGEEGFFVVCGESLNRLAATAGSAPARLAHPAGRNVEVDVVKRVSSRVAVVRMRLRGKQEAEGEQSLSDVLGEVAQVPLPPYAAQTKAAEDAYHTIFAKAAGSVTTPSASLPFTLGMVADLRELEGFRLEQLTLHQGYYHSFAEDEDVTTAPGDAMWDSLRSEAYVLPYPVAGRLDADWADPSRRVLAVGTDVARALESCAARGQFLFEANTLAAGKGCTDLAIRPGAYGATDENGGGAGGGFRVVDALLTSLHRPGRAPLSVLAAFLGPELARRAYAEAIQHEYRFFAFGDAMLVL